MTVKLFEDMPCNKRFVYLIAPYIIRRKGNNKHLIIKPLMVINPVIGWFEITQYYDKHVITIVNLVKTMWLTRYPYWPWIQRIPIQKECVIKSKSISSGNPISNAILKRTHLILLNLVWKYNVQETYVYKYDPWMVILDAATFSVCNFLYLKHT